MIDLTLLREFGSTGLRVSPLCIGTSSWGSGGNDATVRELADAWAGDTLSTGFLDTSNLYGDSLSEGLVGDAIRAAGGLRDGLVVQTKLDRRLPDDDFGYDQMWRSLEQSLERLGLDTVQVLHLHDPEIIGFEAAMAPGGPVEALVAMKERGLAASIGISGGPVEMLERFVETGLFDALVTHNRFTLVDRSAGSLLDAATRRGMAVTNAAPYGAGVLTGDARFAHSYGYRPIRAEVRDAVEAMTRLCAETGVPLAAAALQFSLREPRIHSTIVGVSSPARYRAAEESARVDIPFDLWQRLDAVAPPASAALDA
jgi:D-threo-aldose 1-dehydrogenase